jgi:hypothetical protein
MTLPANHEQSFLESLSSKWKDARKTSADRKRLVSLFCEAVADGVLTDDEISRLHELMAETGLTLSDIAGSRADIFDRAVKSLESQGYTLQKIASVERIQSFLQIDDGDIPKQKAALARLKYLAAIRECGPQPIAVDNLVLRKGELAYWQEPGTLYEEKVVSRRYEGGSRGVSIRLMRGVSFRVGAHQGQLVSDTANVAISTGSLVVTNQRLVFMGDSKSFETKFENLLDMEHFPDGVVYSERNKQKQRKIIYCRRNGEVVAEIISSALDRRE